MPAKSKISVHGNIRDAKGGFPEFCEFDNINFNVNIFYKWYKKKI